MLREQELWSLWSVLNHQARKSPELSMNGLSTELSGGLLKTVQFRLQKVEELSRPHFILPNLPWGTLKVFVYWNFNTQVSTLSSLPPSPLHTSPHFNHLQTWIFLLGTTMPSEKTSRIKRTQCTPFAKSLYVKYSRPLGSSGYADISRASSGCSTPLSHPRFQSSRSASPILGPSSPIISDLASSSQPVVRPQPRIQVSSLLAETNNRTYHLEIEQHPVSAAAFGMMPLSRVAITPPIIVRLTVRDPSGNSIVPDGELPFLVAHLSLYNSDGTTSLDTGSYIGRGSIEKPPMLYGHLVATVEQLEDLQGNMGLFLLFPDVSIRAQGRYQLGILLTRITNPESTGLLSEHGTPLAQVRTQPFDVVPREEYFVAPPTRLTQCFIRQGARMFLNHSR